MLRLEIASLEALRYSCCKFHYTKKVLDNINLGFSVFNENEFCGIIAYGRGTNPQIAKPYGLVQGQVIELVRVALNGKQEHTSKAVSISLKLIKKYAPLVKVVVSYADGNQNHLGIIYQATNWLYTGKTAKEVGLIIKNKLIHRRTIGKKYGTSNIEYLRANIDPDAKIINGEYKFKYVFPLEKNMIEVCKKLSKPYPKKI